MTVTKKPDHRGEHEVSRKTIARGVPGNPGVTVVTTLVCFLLCTRGCGRIRRPAFPAPSLAEGVARPANLGRIAPRECGGVSLRHCERSEAIHAFFLVCSKWIASLRSQ